LCRTRNTPAPVLSPEALSPQGVKTGRDRRKAEKQKQAHIRRLRRQEAELLAGQEALETEKAALEAELDQPAVYSSVEKARAVQARLDQVSMEAEENLRKWEVRAEELEKALAGDFRT
jgi:predicted RNase H-like nuclease (RuvC/YqgF family)